MELIEKNYKRVCETKSDINEHLPTIKKYAEECEAVIEFGVRGIVSTWALLAGNPKEMISVDIANPSVYGANIADVENAAIEACIHFEFWQKSIKS